MWFFNLPEAGGAAQAITATATTTVATVPATTEPSFGDFLTKAAATDLGLLSILFLVLGIAVLAAGAWLYFVGKNRWQGVNKVNYRLGNTWGLLAMILGGLAVLFVLFRVLGIAGLNARFWLYLVALIWAAGIGYGAVYFSTRYRRDLAAAAAKPQRGRSAPAARVRAAGGNAAAVPARPKGEAGNPRGTSERGDRRRAKR